MENNTQKFITRTLISIVVVSVVAVIAAYVWKFHSLKLSDSTAIWGSFGDYLAGTLSGILTPVTVILIWLTYKSQKEESTNQGLIIVKQMDLLSQQSFEQTFFSWLQSIQNIRPIEKAEQASSEYITSITNEINNYLRYGITNTTDENYLGIMKAMADQLTGSYSHTYTRVKDDGHGWLDTYSYAVMEFISFIDENDIYPRTLEQKQQYVSILISHLNNGDRVLLGAFAISKQDIRYLDLLKKYNFFTKRSGQENVDRLLKVFQDTNIK